MSDKAEKRKKEKKKKNHEDRVSKNSKPPRAHEKITKENIRRAATSAFTLLAHDRALDPTLSSLFAIKQPPVKSNYVQDIAAAAIDEHVGDLSDDVNGAAVEVGHDDAVDEIDGTVEDADQGQRQRKRKRKDAGEQLEDVYMQRLAREEAKDAERAAAVRIAKRAKNDDGLASVVMNDDNETSEEAVESEDDQSAADGVEDDADSDGDEDGVEDGEVDKDRSPPPRHETEVAADVELSKANRTVFLGNVSTDAITSKSSRKALLNHLASFLDQMAPPEEGHAKQQVESIRFRSTPYASAIPKKAAFAKRELMDATTKSTNAYAVYSSSMLAREAVKRLNGTVVLGRHLRLDLVAHPAKVDHRRCVFVGNLGFVDDDSNMLKADAEEGREKRKQGKEPADVEEGLWRTFGKCGTVESVRVIRDSTTRVGKGIAYVQFDDENAVEAALLYNDKKFPPMLPRKLRVSRAKAQKRNAKPGSGRPMPRPSANGYQRKITPQEASQVGRAGKLLGRAAAARMRNPEANQTRAAADVTKMGNGIQKPENFIFEGHRASAKQGKAGLKLGARSKKSKVTKRSAAFRSSHNKA